MQRDEGMQLLQGAGRKGKTPRTAQLNGLAGWLFGLMQGWKTEHKGKQKHMQLVEVLPLGGKRQLMLVSCEGERFLVGSGAESVETIVRVHPMVSSSAPTRNLDETC